MRTLRGGAVVAAMLALSSCSGSFGSSPPGDGASPGGATGAGAVRPGTPASRWISLATGREPCDTNGLGQFDLVRLVARAALVVEQQWLRIAGSGTAAAAQ